MYKLKQLIAVGFVTLLFSAGLVGYIPAVAAQTPSQAACDGIEATGGNCSPVGAKNQVSDLIKTVINVLSIIVGAVSVIMIIIGGFRYVLSGGDGNATKGAKDTIMYAVIGLVIVIFAQVIVQFVFTQTQRTP